MKSLATKQKRSRRVLVLIVLFALGIIAIATLVWFIVLKDKSVDNATITDVKQEQVSSDTSPTSSSLPSKTNEQSGTNQPPAETPSTPPEKPRIERAGGNPTVKVVATFQQASTGSCELQLSKPGAQTLSYTSSITVGSSYYTCSFSIQRSVLGEGTWSAVVIHHIGNASTASDPKEVD